MFFRQVIKKDTILYVYSPEVYYGVLTISVILYVFPVVFYGVLTIGIAFLTPLLGDSVVQLALSIVGTLGAPIFAIFALGIFCPFVNSWVSLFYQLSP